MQISQDLQHTLRRQTSTEEFTSKEILSSPELFLPTKIHPPGQPHPHHHWELRSEPPFRLSRNQSTVRTNRRLSRLSGSSISNPNPRLLKANGSPLSPC